MSTPSPMIGKVESQEVRTKIRTVLLNVWDPIGVRDEPFAQDEYDGYIGGIYELLEHGASRSEIAKFLYWVAHDRMGFDQAQMRDMDETVAALVMIRLEKEEA